MLQYIFVNTFREIFPRQGKSLTPIAPVISPADVMHKRELKRGYTEHARNAFPDDAIAVSVVRANLANRLHHASRNFDAAQTVMTQEPNKHAIALLSRLATTLPEERVAAFMAIDGLPALEAHAELLNGHSTHVTDFAEGRIALNAIASDFGGDIIEEDPTSRMKVTRIATIAGESHAVIRSKIDGLSADIGGKVELKMRRSGAVALAAVDDETVVRGLKILGNPTYSSYEDTGTVEAHRRVVDEYLAANPAAYTGYVQSYYLTRPDL